jgi:hypothetical protein
MAYTIRNNKRAVLTLLSGGAITRHFLPASFSFNVGTNIGNSESDPVQIMFAQSSFRQSTATA